MASPAVLRAALDITYYTGMSAASRRMFRGAGHIFCLHHVCPGGGRQTGFAPNSKLEVEPQFLADMIDLVRARGFETLSLAEAIARLETGQVGNKPFSVFTLDDGYKDNVEHAKPVFDAKACPYTIFVAPSIADGTCALWWRLLEFVINAEPHFSGQVGGAQFDLPTRTVEEKSRAWDVLFPKLEVLDQHQQRSTIRAWAEARGISADDYCQSVAMGWDQLRALRGDPFCTIGAHTVNHFAVARMSEEQSWGELSQARALIEKEMDQEIHFNAYPYGDHPNASARDFELAARAGYRASLTTRKGVIHAGHGAHLQALPRIMVSGRYQELRYIDALISGLPTALLNRFKKVDAA